VFFSRNKSAGTVFRLVFSAKGTGPKVIVAGHLEPMHVFSPFFLLMLGMYLFVSKGKIMVNIETGSIFELNVRVHLNGDANYLHSC